MTHTPKGESPEIVVRLNRANTEFIDFGIRLERTLTTSYYVICQRHGRSDRGKGSMAATWYRWIDLFEVMVNPPKMAWRVAESWIYGRADELAYRVNHDGTVKVAMKFEIGKKRSERNRRNADLDEEEAERMIL